MRKIIPTSQALEAARLSASGLTIDHVVAMLGLLPNSRSAIWRAIHEVQSATKRVAHARLTGDYTDLSVGEALIVDEQRDAAVEEAKNDAAKK